VAKEDGSIMVSGCARVIGCDGEHALIGMVPWPAAGFSVGFKPMETDVAAAG